MNDDERMPEMIEPNLDDSRIQAALDELRGKILKRYPDATFHVYRGEDPEAIWLEAIADVDDLDDVTGVVISRVVDMQVDEGLPVYVVGGWPPERLRAYLREQRALSHLDPAEPVPSLTA